MLGQREGRAGWGWAEWGNAGQGRTVVGQREGRVEWDRVVKGKGMTRQGGQGMAGWGWAEWGDAGQGRAVLGQRECRAEWDRVVKSKGMTRQGGQGMAGWGWAEWGVAGQGSSITLSILLVSLFMCNIRLDANLRLCNWKWKIIVGVLRLIVFVMLC